MAALQDEPFKYHKPGVLSVGAIKDFRNGMDYLHDLILQRLPPSRERALAITNLQQAGMWLNLAATLADPETVTMNHDGEVMHQELHNGLRHHLTDAVLSVLANGAGAEHVAQQTER